MNSRRWSCLKKRPAVGKAMSKRKFNFTSKERIKKLKETKLKKSTESKVDGAVTAHNDWRQDKLDKFNHDSAIYFANLYNLDSLTKENLQHALCRFVPKIMHKCGEGPFPGATLYQMVAAIQKYLVINKLKWSLLDDDDFEECRTVLDNVMQECTAQNIGVVKWQEGIISYEAENGMGKGHSWPGYTRQVTQYSFILDRN